MTTTTTSVTNVKSKHINATQIQTQIRMSTKQLHIYKLHDHHYHQCCFSQMKTHKCDPQICQRQWPKKTVTSMSILYSSKILIKLNHQILPCFPNQHASHFCNNSFNVHRQGNFLNTFWQLISELLKSNKLAKLRRCYNRR